MKRIITIVVVLLSLQMSAQCVLKAGGGSSCTFVIKVDGTLWAWGRNNYGQLGIGNTTNTAVKTQVGTASNWQSIEGGQFHTVALKADGSLWTWGYNASGQLGLNNTTNKTIPTQVSSTNVWTSIAAGYDHTVAITNDGSMYAWGLNNHGQLGDGSGTNRSVPTLIGTGWKSVSAGNNVTIAVKTDGTLWGWGEAGQVGDGTSTDRYSPVQLGTGTNWKSVSRGVSHSLAVKTDGTLWAWGANTRGQLGNGTTTSSLVPTQAGTDTNWESAKAGFFFGIGKKTDGTIWSWGQGGFYSLGLGASITANVLVPTKIGTDTDWQTISVGSSSLFAGAIKNDGTFWVWGYNNYSQLGDGLTASLPVPTFITCPASTSMTQTACDNYTWSETGTTYTTSGIYTNPLTNNDLHLTINNSTTSTTSETACESYTWVANGTTYTQSGTYTSVTTGASGCPATATLNLTIHNAVAPSADSPQVITEAITGTATIADIVISPSTVVWYGSQSDALLQVNALNPSTVLTNGNTYYAVNTVQGCVSNPFPVLVSVTLGNATFDLATFTLYPNPASDFITMRYPKGIDNVIVTNMIGQQLISTSFTTEEAKIDVSNLPCGTYFVKVYSGDLSKMLKFIKK